MEEENQKLFDDIYRSFIQKIQNLYHMDLDNEITNEIEDITLLWSLRKQDIENMIKNNIDINEKEFDLNLKYNIINEFWHIIKTPSFLNKLYQLCLLNIKSNSTNELGLIYDKTDIIQLYVNIYDIFLSLDKTKMDDYVENSFSIINTIISDVSSYDFIQYLTINNHQKFIYDEPIEKLISLILFNLYLECAIYQYNDIIGFIKQCKEISYKLGTHNYTNNNEFKNDIISWITNKQHFKSKLYNDKSKININIMSESGHEYILFSDIFDSEELTKIKLLVKQRNIIPPNTTFKTKYISENITNEEYDKQINDIFQNNRFYIFLDTVDPTKSIVNTYNDDPTTVKYNILQAIHAYDQIIYTLCYERQIYLHELKTNYININTIKETYKHIITLRQYINYPLTFQYRINDFRQCHNLMNENTMKIIFKKWLKLRLVIDYCNSNKITNMEDKTKKSQMINYIKNISTLNISESQILTNNYNKNTMNRILNDIHKTNNIFTTNKPYINYDNLELHRIKYNLLELNNNIYIYENNINPISTSIELIYGELFKEIYIFPSETTYDYMKKLIDFTKIINPITDPLFINSVTERESGDIDMNTYVNNFKIYKSKNPIEYNNLLYRNETPTIDITIDEYINLSIYQLIEVLNNNPILSLSEKLYQYLVALNEIRELPKIDTIIEMLRMGLPIKKIAGSSYEAVDINDDKIDSYMLSNDTYMNKDINKLLILNFPPDIIDLLLKNISILDANINDSDFYVATYDVNNRIKFNIGQLILDINNIDTNRFIKNYYKIIRNQYLKIYPNISTFKSEKIPYDDMYFYNMSIYIDILGINKILPINYFSLGYVGNNGTTEIINFENPLIDANVRMIEYTNGFI